MISLSPSEDQQQLIDVMRRFAVNDLQPAAHESDEHERVAANLITTGWELGLVPTAIPEDFGGLGELSAVTGALALEELAYGDLSAALQIMTPALFAFPVILYGTAEQREQHLPAFMEATAPARTAAWLEPGVFFDPNHLKTTATITGETVTITGEKAYVPLGATAEHLLVYARNSESGETEAYMVATATPGVGIGAREKLMGVRALPTYRITFNDVQVGVANKLGGTVGCDAHVLLNRARVALAAMAVGVSRAAFEYARDYAKQRVQFGVPIAQKQAIAFMLAEMAIEVDSARLLVWEAAAKLDTLDGDTTREAYLASQYANKASMFVTDSAVQTLGGYGFIREYPVERLLRNVRGFGTFDGLAIL